MAKKITGWKTKGMNRDLSVSAFNPEFSFENMNLRLSTNEGNTLLSWVNEKGTQQYVMWNDTGNAPEYYFHITNPLFENESGTFYSLYGNVIGTAVLNHQLVLFTTRTYTHEGREIHQDRIYKCVFEDDEKKHLAVTLLFKGDLKLDEEHPIETLVSFEADHIQKVYWVDGKNQPRMINIAGDPSKWQGNNTAFDFVPAINGGNISVVNHPSGGGLFAPGVIQYCFTYVNKWGQQSNIVDVSPLYYLSHSDRGASPESKTGNLFNITINNADTKFDLIRIYSIQRTSLNAVPIVRQLDDVTITGNTATCIDNGTEGLMVDPTELLYIGGKEIVALTMADKDNTLFLGNIQQKGNILPSELPSKGNGFVISNIKFSGEEQDDEVGYKSVNYGAGTGVYSYENLIKNHSQKDITTFKGGEWYRFGYQLQRKTGEWTEPILLGDKQNTIYPDTNVESSAAGLIKAACSLSFGSTDMSAFKKVRPLVIYPNMSERNVICQGVLNPTVFNVLDRKDNSPYAQASWYFRPIMKGENKGETVKKEIDAITKAVVTAPEPLTTAGIASVDRNIAEGMVNGTVSETNPYNDLYFFANNGYLTSLYVVVIRTPKSIAAYGPILESGYLSIHEETWVGMSISGDDRNNVVSNNNKYYFQGAIKLGESGNDAVWAFTRESPWPIPAVRTETLGQAAVMGEIKRYYSCNYNGVTYLESTDKPFPIYKFLSRTDQNLYYMRTIPGDGSPSSFNFRFYTSQNFYKVEFKAIDVSSGYNIDLNNHGGSGLRFQHYSSLYCSSEITEKDNNVQGTDATQARRSIEIQGSLAIYNTPFAPKPKRTAALKSDADNEAVSNTQFFVDQSIVTLNSPDIEFDTDVQNYPMEGSGLKLRIIGYIPITANASAFSIETGSSMMPLGSNKPIGGSFIEQMVYYSKKTADTKISFGTGARSSQNIVYNNISSFAGNRLVADYLWNDALIMSVNDSEVECQSSDKAHDFLIHPWHRSGSLNNDFRGNDTASSLLKTKKESNILFSTHSIYQTEYSDGNGNDYSMPLNEVTSQIVLTENEEIMNYRLPINYSSKFSGINYFPNINKILYNENGYTPWVKELYNDETVEDVTTPISMKYKSTSHAVIAIQQAASGGSTFVRVLPNTLSDTSFNNIPYWDETAYHHFSPYVQGFNSREYNYLWLGELQRGVNTSPFTATEENNRWLIGGDAVSINSTTVDNTTTYSASLVWDRGDTYYQRYDCLKTYPFSTEDPNQIIEILSFMCETRVNLDGRYDKNRGLLDNTNIHPKNFNLLNDIYSQKDNFFVSRKLSDDGANNTYPNYITYSKTKTAGADVDLWTNVNLGSVLEMDGDNGEVRDLEKFNNQLICFQDTGISQILYNENVQINSAEGVPIEIANSGKVQGKRYFTNTIGCSNKWSIANTPSGIYFIDSNDKSIYKFDGQLANISLQGGMNSWSKQNLGYQNPWNPLFPYMTGDNSAFVTYYDRQNQDILFINKDKALAYSEKLGTFTSFYDYGKIPYFVNFDDTGIWIKHNGATDGGIASDLYLHQGGNYCKFFGVNKPYWMTLVGNPEPQTDKIFTNLEFRACVDGDGTVANNKFTPTLPFDSIETWDEYQHGIANLGTRNGHTAQLHHSSTAGNDTLKRKFRIWRCDIPRNNWDIMEEPILPANPSRTQEMEYQQAKVAYDAWMKSEADKGIYRHYKKPNDRMRNPWLYLKLMKNAESNSNKALSRAEIHDIMMTYFS